MALACDQIYVQLQSFFFFFKNKHIPIFIAKSHDFAICFPADLCVYRQFVLEKQNKPISTENIVLATQLTNQWWQYEGKKQTNLGLKMF